MANGGDESDPFLDRRQYIALVGASSIALAGCSGGGDDSGDDGGSNDGQQSDEEETGDGGGGGDGGDGDDSGDDDQQSDDEEPEPANFALSLSPLPAVERGGELRVDVTVENTGGQESTQSITVTLDGDNVATEPVTLGAGGQTSISRMLTVPNETGEYELTASSDDDSVTATFTVEVGTTPQTFSGTGQATRETVQIEDGLVVTEATHDGNGEFKISLEELTLGTLVRTDGNFDGAEARLIDKGEYTLAVVADGEWEVTIRQPRANSGDTLPVTYTGTGSEVVGPVELAQEGTARFSHTGNAAVQVTVYTEQRPAGPVLFRSFGTFEDDTVYAAGLVSWVDIDADGDWTLELE